MRRWQPGFWTGLHIVASAIGLEPMALNCTFLQTRNDRYRLKASAEDGPNFGQNTESVLSDNQHYVFTNSFACIPFVRGMTRATKMQFDALELKNLKSLNKQK